MLMDEDQLGYNIIIQIPMIRIVSIGNQILYTNCERLLKVSEDWRVLNVPRHLLSFKWRVLSVPLHLLSFPWWVLSVPLHLLGFQ